MASVKPMHKFREQLRRNTVALISVVIAVGSLSYNTWRNERSEYNRNLRQASFEVLLHLGDLRELVYHLHYDMETIDENIARTGWATVFTIRDLSRLLEPPLPEAADTLRATWGIHWKNLGSSDAGKNAIEAEIDAMRDSTLKMLQELD